MNPLTELKKILSGGQRVTTGVVVSNSTGVLMVSTVNGTQAMSQTGATSYRAGDKVQVQGQIVTGKLASEDGIRVYTV